MPTVNQAGAPRKCRAQQMFRVHLLLPLLLLQKGLLAAAVAKQLPAAMLMQWLQKRLRQQCRPTMRNFSVRCRHQLQGLKQS